MLNTYSISFYLRGFGHGVQRVASAKDALHALQVFTAMMDRMERKHIEDYTVRSVTESSVREDQWPVIHASEATNV